MWSNHVEHPVQPLCAFLFRPHANHFEFRPVSLPYRDQEAGTDEQIDIIELQFSVVVQVLEYRKDVAIVLFRLGPLRTMTAVFDLQLVQPESLRQLIEFRRRRVGNIKPLQVREHSPHAGPF